VGGTASKVSCPNRKLHCEPEWPFNLHFIHSFSILAMCKAVCLSSPQELQSSSRKSRPFKNMARGQKFLPDVLLSPSFSEHLKLSLLSEKNPSPAKVAVLRNLSHGALHGVLTVCLLRFSPCHFGPPASPAVPQHYS